MSRDFRRQLTTSRAFWSIYEAHRARFMVFSTISQPDGNPHGDPDQARMYTEWGFVDDPVPVIAIDETWTIDRDNPSSRKLNHEQKFYLCIAKESEA